MIYTTVMNMNGKKLWEGLLPIVTKGQRMYCDGNSYWVVDSSVALYGHVPQDSEHDTRQTVVMERTRD